MNQDEIPAVIRRFPEYPARIPEINKEIDRDSSIIFQAVPEKEQYHIALDNCLKDLSQATRFLNYLSGAFTAYTMVYNESEEFPFE